jgi:2-dehydro-3-deoxyphosphogluconate aldolase/(4S)-4-hydroxy-2-oxoglutarate aldolase
MLGPTEEAGKLNDEIKAVIEANKIIVIVRGQYGEALIGLAKAMFEGGVRMLEVTFDQSDRDSLAKTPGAIRMVGETVPGMLVGAGTVMTAEQADAAAAAGARYIISPNTDEEVIRYTKRKGLISIPGAMTPSEIAAAHKYGADYVKVFPVCDLGVGYIKNIRAPLSHIKLIATAGVNEENFAEFLKAGMVGAGVSGRLTDKNLVAAGDFAELTRRAAAFMKIARENG